ncbi:MAG: hypothetical protein Q9166_002543 [cf. Caloplaca sp. 2 TL-2023]
MTKRKSREDTALSSRPRKRQASSAPKASTKAIIARNSSTSPLLRLSPELRNRIWTEVIGDRLIHLRYDHWIDNPPHFDIEDSDSESLAHRSPWKHVVCQHDCPEDRPEEKKVVLDVCDEEHVLWRRPHDECRFPDEDDLYLHDAEPINCSDRPAMCLTILCASHQIYTEANRILWTTNTFSFADGPTFKHFMKTRNIHQKRLVGNLRFEMHWGDAEEKHWNSALNMALIRSLTGLQTIRLQITCDIEGELWHATRDRFVWDTSYAEGLRKLSILPLTSAKVAIRKSPNYRNWGFDGELWRKKDMDTCAKEVRKMLVNPRGAEIYQKHQDERISRRDRFDEDLRAGIVNPWVVP